jgi:hypothetical protein
LKKTKYEKIMETSPYSSFGITNVYNGTNRKLKILGTTVAKP